MRKLFAVIILTAAAFAQGGIYSGIALNSTGRPAAGAAVRICSETATGTPCSPTATVYSDSALTIVQSSTVADANGNFSFYAAPSFYKVQVTSSGSTYTYPVQVPLSAKGNPNYNVKAYGAVGDGTTDDTAALQAAITAAASGGVVYFPCGTYKFTATLIPASNTTIAGAGACTIFKFSPSAPFVGGVNDRPFHISSQLSSRRQMAAGAIAVGATTFTANSSADTADLVQGDWVLITETDSGAGDIVIIDWVQVKSVSTVTVTVQLPFRKAFPNTRAYSSTSGLAFVRVTSLKENITFRDFKIMQPAQSQTNPSLSIGAVRNTLVSNVIIDNASGQSFYAYKAQGLKIIHSTQLGANLSTSEIGACVDVSLLGNNFGEIGTSQDSYAQANTSALSMDLGTAFFSVIGNSFTNGGNVMMTMYYGVSDGVVSGNVFSYTRDGGIGSGSGLAALGAQRVTISNNTLNGGTAGGTGILVQDTGTLNVNITSSGNVISFNNISNFTNRFGTQSASDVYFNPNTSAPNTEITGGLNINNPSFGLIARQTSSTGFTSLRVQNDINSSVRSLEMDYSGSAYASPIVTGAPSGEAGAIYTTGAFPLVLGANNTARLIIDSSGNVGIPKALRTGTASQTDLAGTCTLGTNCVITFTQTYTSAPVCVATDTTAAAAVKVVVSTTTATFTGTGTDVLNYVCVGRN